MSVQPGSPLGRGCGCLCGGGVGERWPVRVMNHAPTATATATATTHPFTYLSATLPDSKTLVSTSFNFMLC